LFWASDGQTGTYYKSRFFTPLMKAAAFRMTMQNLWARGPMWPQAGFHSFVDKIALQPFIWLAA
jgi:hypothetical protein